MVMPWLAILEGPNRGAVLRILPDENRIGRDEEGELFLPDEGVSRLHAKIVRAANGRFEVADCESKNGTLLNGVRIEGRHPLEHGDEVQVGKTVLLFLDDDSVGSSPPGFASTVTLAGETAPAGRAPSRARTTAGAVVGESAAWRGILATVARVAPLETTVLITGESGTGKERLAEALHRLSPRRRGPFVVLNSASLEPAFVESELFGHERGAFTGAVARRLGKLELARGGTLFLDELGELKLEAQAKLLRVVEQRDFERLGGGERLTTDARIIAATNRDLEALVAEGKFREDLFFRLNVVEIRVPPLRERTEDVVPLAQHFLEELRGRTGARARAFSPEALKRLERHRFPGNVRELRNLVERCLIFVDKETIEATDLSLGGEQAAPEPEGKVATLEAVERREIERALAATDGNKTQAAKLLGVDRVTLYAKIRRHRLDA
jgi:DNA-binding NtrC family response regulator